MESKSNTGNTTKAEFSNFESSYDLQNFQNYALVAEDCRNENKSERSACSGGADVAQDYQTTSDTACNNARLPVTNGTINRMTKEQMKEKLEELKLCTSGLKDTLKKRLKDYYQRQKTAQSQRKLMEDEKTQFDYLVVIDFEATCSEKNENFIHEIIEFPAVLVNTQTQAVCHVFQSYCKPRVNPILTEFCTNLTGISQAQVDQAEDFSEVFKYFQSWLSLHKLGTEYKFAVVTDGPWDMAKFLKTQIELSNMAFPKWAKQWINLRKSYTNFYGGKRRNLHRMLEELGLTFQGRPHCGLDDAYNIAAIAVKLLQDGCILRANEHYRQGHKGPQKHTGFFIAPYQRHGIKATGNIHSAKNESSSGSKPKAADVPQEGEDIDDLIRYLKIQKS